jgi:hypothetical protein
LDMWLWSETGSCRVPRDVLLIIYADGGHL